MGTRRERFRPLAGIRGLRTPFCATPTSGGFQPVPGLLTPTYRGYAHTSPVHSQIRPLSLLCGKLPPQLPPTCSYCILPGATCQIGTGGYYGHHLLPAALPLAHTCRPGRRL